MIIKHHSLIPLTDEGHRCSFNTNESRRCRNRANHVLRTSEEKSEKTYACFTHAKMHVEWYWGEPVTRSMQR